MKEQTGNGEMENLKIEIGEAANRAMMQICGGGRLDCDLNELTMKSVCFTNKSWSSIDGKPHDVEVRVALSYLQRRKRKRSSTGAAASPVSIISDMGLLRTMESPRNLATLLCLAMEPALPGWDLRSNKSGIICAVSPGRRQTLRAAGRLPCPQCVKWCKGEKGLWWHQQREHLTEHSLATAAAASERNVCAIVPYNVPQQSLLPLSLPRESVSRNHSTDNDIFECCKNGDLPGLKRFVEAGINPAQVCDRRGASPIHWASGSGHLNLVRCLVEEHRCDPQKPQRGKRSFGGRTALHWSARNGHLNVVRYLVLEREVDMEATTKDGTTAFCWACWQGHLEVMKFLHSRGCNVHSRNSFGCNAVLWCAQGSGDTLESLKWLRSVDCDMMLVNSNGHSALHKVSQRCQRAVIDWLVSLARESQELSFEWFGPDTEHCCPSDLAGMEGHKAVAQQVAKLELELAQDLQRLGQKLPKWAGTTTSPLEALSGLQAWEPRGGVRRIAHALRQGKGANSG